MPYINSVKQSVEMTLSHISDIQNNIRLSKRQNYSKSDILDIVNNVKRNVLLIDENCRKRGRY